MLVNGQLSTHAIREVEEYKNFCDRPRDQRPLPDEVIGVSFLITLESLSVKVFQASNCVCLVTNRVTTAVNSVEIKP